MFIQLENHSLLYLYQDQNPPTEAFVETGVNTDNDEDTVVSGQTQDPTPSVSTPAGIPDHAVEAVVALMSALIAQKGIYLPPDAKKLALLLRGIVYI